MSQHYEDSTSLQDTVMQMHRELEDTKDKLELFEQRYRDTDQKLAEAQLREIAYKRHMIDLETQLNVANMGLTVANDELNAYKEKTARKSGTVSKLALVQADQPEKTH